MTVMMMVANFYARMHRLDVHVLLDNLHSLAAIYHFP